MAEIATHEFRTGEFLAAPAETCRRAIDRFHRSDTTPRFARL